MLCGRERPLFGPPQTVSSLSCVPFSVHHLAILLHSFANTLVIYIEYRTDLSFPITTVWGKAYFPAHSPDLHHVIQKTPLFTTRKPRRYYSECRPQLSSHPTRNPESIHKPQPPTLNPSLTNIRQPQPLHQTDSTRNLCSVILILGYVTANLGSSRSQGVVEIDLLLL